MTTYVLYVIVYDSIYVYVQCPALFLPTLSLSIGAFQLVPFNGLSRWVSLSQIVGSGLTDRFLASGVIRRLEQ